MKNNGLTAYDGTSIFTDAHMISFEPADGPTEMITVDNVIAWTGTVTK